MYLRGFADDNEELWVYDRKERSIKKLHVKSTQFKNDFYTVRDNDGKKSDELEKWLASAIEGPVADIIRKLDPDFRFEIRLLTMLARWAPL